jgi:hypothetical protein
VSRRVLVTLSLAALAAVAADVALLVRGGDLVLAGVTAVAVVIVVGLVLESVTQPATTWSRPVVDAPGPAAPDPGLSALRRLVTDNQTSRVADTRLQQRLARLVGARRRAGVTIDPELDRLCTEDRPIRFATAQVARIIDRIEDL